MKRIFSVLMVALVMVAMVVVMSVPAFAAPQRKAQDNRNNATFPGFSVGQGEDVSHEDRAWDNTDANCFKHEESEKGAPAQCYAPN